MSSTLRHLELICPNAVTIDSKTLASIIGVSRSTINNAGSAFPLPSLKFGRKRYYRLIDVASFIDKTLGIVDPSSTARPQDETSPIRPAPSRGRPPKAKAKRRAHERAGS